MIKPGRSSVLSTLAIALLVGGCADVDVPSARNLSIPSPSMAAKRQPAINEKPDSVVYLPLGSDVLVPEVSEGLALPSTPVGPFELRSETLAGALQLILADYEMPIAFESNEGLTRTVTVSNLRGPLNQVVERVCSLADLYCAFEDGTLVVKETQTFTVVVPPITDGENDVLATIAKGVEAITGSSPITESTTRSIIYQATSRTAKDIERYFQRLRASTALIVFEVYIWEVELNSANATGIDWSKIDTFGKFNMGIDIPGGTGLANAVSIGLPTTGDVEFGGSDVFEFISTFGAVKTISQPQITVLSGSEATLRAASTTPYISSLTRSVDEGQVVVSTETDTVDTGFTMTINSAWDNATIYGTIAIELQEFLDFTDFPVQDDELSLPNTTERELTTQVRIRPGDSLLIAGLVRETDAFSKDGLGFKDPLIPTSRDTESTNSELVILLKPRVIVYTNDQPGELKDEVVKPSLPGKVMSPAQSHSQKKEDVKPGGSIAPDLLNPTGAKKRP
ncbi:MAG: type II and III secretion system family protein [Alphaproteobacteria bacterium]|nr:type II and III secretion system family protein [Alphaproteobacteria bacterium]